MVVGEDDVEVGPLDHAAEDRHRITADADEPGLAGGLDGAEGRQCLLDHAVDVAELDVVAEEDVEVIHPQAVQADVDALDHAPGGKVEVVAVVPAELRPEEV